ncbi:hypothetical protein JWG45_17180 [Leptospira sp. 201903070]|uniref:Uncharacterized protein n=1 Tax=Leptospira ainlahdjerensis TaxID=2810033 RepID=A0ABS2UES4_9LEPT|nr:hypothetical protein [Leptospira ainlahdjerensis]MBM9578881.1 hypothetical protein [Leptospira ainlahdjerensis]
MSVSQRPMPENDSKSETGSESDSIRKLSKDELIEACMKIARMKKPIAEIARILKPLGIPYYTVFHVFMGKSNHPRVLEILTKLGIQHGRKPIREPREKKIKNE